MNSLGNIFQAILTTGMAVTALVAIILDNLLPGASPAERGLDVWEQAATDEAWAQAELSWDQMKEAEENTNDRFKRGS